MYDSYKTTGGITIYMLKRKGGADLSKKTKKKKQRCFRAWGVNTRQEIKKW